MKPLYYFFDDQKPNLASEIKTLISSGLYEIKINFEALKEYITFQNLISNNTHFKDIKMLMPGNNLTYSL